MMTVVVMMMMMLLLLNLLCHGKIPLQAKRKVDGLLQGKALPEVSDPFLHFPRRHSLWQLFNACSVFVNNLE